MRVNISLEARRRHHGDQERCLEAGMDAYVETPIEARELPATIDRVVPSADPIDRASLMEHVGGDPATLRELIELYQEDSAPLLADIRKAAAAGDPQTVAAMAHRFRGSAATFSAAAAVDAARRLETIGRSGDLSDLDAAVTALVAEAERLATALERLQNETTKCVS